MGNKRELIVPERSGMNRKQRDMVYLDTMRICVQAGNFGQHVNSPDARKMYQCGNGMGSKKQHHQSLNLKGKVHIGHWMLSECQKEDRSTSYLIEWHIYHSYCICYYTQ